MTKNTIVDKETVYVAVVVEDEIAWVYSMPKDSVVHESLLENPKVIDTTSLPYFPAKGSVWDGQNFNIPKNLDIQHESQFSSRSPEYSDFKTFSYLLNNVCTGSVSINPKLGERLIYAYLSNPDFVDITSLIADPTRYGEVVGATLKNGEIATQ